MVPPDPAPRGRKRTKVDPQDLLQSAANVFGAQGVAGASVRAIAKEAGCDPALIYYHFGNKEGVFEALLDHLFRTVHGELESTLAATVDQSTAAKLLGIQQVYVRLIHGAGRGLQGLIRGEVVRGAEGIRRSVAARMRPLFGTITAVFTEGIRRQELRPDLVVPLVAMIYIRTTIELLEVVPAMSAHLVGIPGAQALPVALQTWFELFWRGIAADPLKPLPISLEKP